MNFRRLIIESALHVVCEEQSGAQHLGALEIGCMFKEDEGLSTLAIAAALRKTGRPFRFVSLEYDPAHVDAAKRILARRDKTLLSSVEFACGHSLASLPRVLSDQTPSVDFASLDGGAVPEICLQEFEMVWARLTARGLIVVDDINLIPAPQSEPHKSRRIFGKGTLILPLLLLAEHLRDKRAAYQAAQQASEPGLPPIRSDWIEALAVSGLTKAFERSRFLLVSGQGITMLVMGRTEPVEALRDRINGMTWDEWIPLRQRLRTAVTLLRQNSRTYGVKVLG